MFQFLILATCWEHTLAEYPPPRGGAWFIEGADEAVAEEKKSSEDWVFLGSPEEYLDRGTAMETSTCALASSCRLGKMAGQLFLNQ